MKKTIRVGITSIGSGVGQSVINSCRLSELPLYVVGLGHNPMAFGQYDCDDYDTLPSIYSDEYIDQLLYLCKKHHIEILIPGLDDELYNISKNIEKFKSNGITPIVSSTKMIELCRDKVKMSRVLNHFTNSFVISHDKESLVEAYNNNEINFPLIAKPRSGFASRGLLVIRSVDDFDIINNDHVVQELAIPHKEDINYSSFVSNLEKGLVSQVSEVSVQIVVSKDGRIIGKCATLNKLNNGVPIEIIPFENASVWEDLGKIIPYFLKIGLRGPINIQGRMTEHGPKWFEMNARFTGITGLRAMMGFNEVDAMVRDAYDINSTDTEIELNNKRIGMRQVTDRTVTFGRNADLDNLVTKTGFYPWKNSKKSVLVTGATGFLGNHLVRKLIDTENVETVICLLRNENKAKLMYGNHDKVKMVSDSDIEQGLLNFGSIDVLIHAALGSVYEEEAIAKELAYTSWILNMAKKFHIPSIINISSQLVYGASNPAVWNEQDPVSPKSPYALANWASELMVSSIHQDNVQTSTTSLRLSSLIGPDKGMGMDNLPYPLSKETIKVEEIKGSSQCPDFLVVRDAADAIISLLNMDSSKWKPIYNVRSGVPLNRDEESFQIN
ncbi:NAD-dependent epimerase/dehydratase family protein [Peribacillus glennii]|uniref:NAD-dependent epimerase/dehydratase family protein n=1 Tax=Peribacillus glennii TaxID=2303991 RepID=A0A372LEJ7_9BACI|nr:NAD-dependent epimerase/dehydratase family protein [Peribacillus glennii]RFU64741.1 NAD-dependent epimerase/dehydratase family protein [Peribacillus glennii]